LRLVHPRAVAAEPAFAAHPSVQHIKVEDGSGQPLGRSFGIKLWPTLVFLKDGREVTRLIRPARPQEVTEAFNSIDPAA
jgi:thioredoxin 1